MHRINLAGTCYCNIVASSYMLKLKDKKYKKSFSFR